MKKPAMKPLDDLGGKIVSELEKIESAAIEAFIQTLGTILRQSGDMEEANGHIKEQLEAWIKDLSSSVEIDQEKYATEIEKIRETMASEIIPRFS